MNMNAMNKFDMLYKAHHMVADLEAVLGKHPAPAKAMKQEIRELNKADAVWKAKWLGEYLEFVLKHVVIENKH